MNKKFNNTILRYSIALIFCMLLNEHVNAQDVIIKIHLRGVYESKITLMPMSGKYAMKTIAEKTVVKNGETAILSVSEDMLPGEFVLRFDYKSGAVSTPYPSEKNIIISTQNLELWVNPPYCNNADSTYFQKDEKENTLFEQFSKENGQRKEKLGVLQSFLMGYDDTESKFYKQGIEEYEKRRKQYNQWVVEQTDKHNALFVSHTFRFQYVPQVSFEGNETDRMSSVIAHYFDGIDFKDTVLIKTSNLKEWMNNYVNLFGAMALTVTLRDSLFSEAGRSAIEKAKLGHPLVYGWMVDYFFNGYEANGIDAGMKILEPYINDPNCLTSKQLEINKRLQGIKTLVEGALAPDIVMKDASDKEFQLSKMQTDCEYTLVLFWSAGCSHCEETIKALYPWSIKPEIRKKLKIVAVSMDETVEEIVKWDKKIIELDGWIHLRGEAGVNSKVANDYAILSTPVMFLIKSDNKIIKGNPGNVEQLIKMIND